MKKIYVLLLILVALISCSKSHYVDVELVPVQNNEYKYLYVNESGEEVISARFEEAELFYDDLALVKENDLYGYINKKGEYVIPNQYANATVFLEGIAFVVKPNEGIVAIDKSGKELFRKDNIEEVSPYFEGYALFAERNEAGKLLYGAMDREGKVVLAPNYTDIRPPYKGVFPVLNSERKWGFVDKEGNMVVDYRFNSLLGLITDEGFYVSDSNVRGVMNEEGIIKESAKFIVKMPMGIDNLSAVMPVNKFGCWGVVDEDEDYVLPSEYLNVNTADGEIFAVKEKSQLFSFIDRDGKYIIAPKFRKATPFINGVAWVQNKKMKWGLIDKNGSYLLTPHFKYHEIPEALIYYGRDYLKTEYYIHPDRLRIKTDKLDVDELLSSINLEPNKDLSPETKYQYLVDNNLLFDSSQLGSMYDDELQLNGVDRTTYNIYMTVPNCIAIYQGDNNVPFYDLNDAVGEVKYKLVLRSEKSNLVRQALNEKLKALSYKRIAHNKYESDEQRVELDFRNQYGYYDLEVYIKVSKRK